MSILRLPVEIVSLLVELLDLDDIFNMALSCRSLSYIIHDRRMCRLALMVRLQSLVLVRRFPLTAA
jgi:hypothetical protein